LNVCILGVAKKMFVAGCKVKELLSVAM